MNIQLNIRKNLAITAAGLFCFLYSFGQPELKIAFGSCGSQDHPLPVFDIVVKHAPSYFIFLGDNIYGDSKEMDTLRAKYERLGSKPSFKKLASKTKILATWDDHDYGWNDTGRHFIYKEESKKIFLDFFKEPLESDRRKHPGIYTSHYIQSHGKKVQVLLLDCRSFRDDLKPYSGEVAKDERYFYQLDYGKHLSPDSTLLGKEQWSWLEKELRVSADLRLICSGTQFGIEFNGYEAWANFPHEQKKMTDLIKRTKANGVIFLTGDVHYAEISRYETPGLYPIYDITSSGLSSTWEFATPNKNRIEGPVMDNHFGLLSVKWDKDPKIKMEIWDVTNNQRIEYSVKLSQISFK